MRQHAPIRKYEIEVGRVHEFKRGSGLPARIPVIDMIEIGAGGGSIAELDERGMIRVGPRSAGADPGPACYGRGGSEPTLTDATLLLGYLDPGFFLGGEMALDLAAAERAVGTIAERLGIDLSRAAFGIHETINEDVARAFRIHAAERGFDYRSAAMVAFGGSGPVHALNVARKLRVTRVIFPVGAGVMSALGLLASPLAFELARSFRVVLDDLEVARFAEIFRQLEEEASGFLRAAGWRPPTSPCASSSTCATAGKATRSRWRCPAIRRWRPRSPTCRRCSAAPTARCSPRARSTRRWSWSIGRSRPAARRAA